MSLYVGSLLASRVRLVTTRRGPWFAECDLVLDDTDTPPTGKTTLTINDAPPMICTVDPRGSGRTGSLTQIRLVAGAAGWDTPAPRQQWHNDAGVISTQVLAPTAIAVGETLVEDAPVRYGVDFVRAAGTAARVLDGLDWYVDRLGITHVGQRTAPVAPDDLQVLAWDPDGQIVELGTSSVLEPDLSLTDDRWQGAIVVRDLEQVFDADGSRATGSCSAMATSRVQDALRNAVVDLSGVVWSRTYRYRVTDQSAIDGRVTLQAISTAVPDLKLITVVYGVPGVTAMIAPGTEVLVDFLEGDRTVVRVRSFDGTKPLALAFGTGASPVARADGTTAALNALATFVSSIASALGASAGPLTGAAMAAALATPSSTFAQALAKALVQVPSTLVKTD